MIGSSHITCFDWLFQVAIKGKTHRTVLVASMSRKVKKQQRKRIRKVHSKRKRMNQRGKGVFSILVPLLATAISTAVANS